jgi:hypothetical protein
VLASLLFLKVYALFDVDNSAKDGNSMLYAE